MKTFLLLFVLCLFAVSSAQKLNFDVILFDKKIGQTTVEKIDKGNGEIQYKLNSTSNVNVLFTHKTSEMHYDVVYKNGQLYSSYVKNVKDGVTEIVNIIWQGTEYLVKKGAEALNLYQPVNFSSILLYFTEPKNMPKIFSERLGMYCTFTKIAEGVYQCKLANGVSNIYRYKDGVLRELEMSKGASVYMRLVQ